MARARNIKPGFFKNEVLAELSFEQRLLFIGLWTLADREGRLEDRPKRIKAELFAFDQVDVDPMLDRLQTEGFLVRYESGSVRYIQITNFVKHQDPHYKEKASEIPPPPGAENQIKATNVTRSQRARILDRDGYKCCQCGSEDHLSIDHIIPISRGGDSSDENLQVLCLRCNTSKSNRMDGEARASKKRKPMFEGDVYDVDQRRPDVEPTKAPAAFGFSDSPFSDSLIADVGAAAPNAPTQAKKPKARKTGIPDGFSVSERVKAWAEKNGYGQLEAHLSAFITKCEANGYEYANWDSAFMEAVRADWAKLRGKTTNGTAPPPEARHYNAAEETARMLAEKNQGTKPPPAHIRAQIAEALKGKVLQ